MIQVKVGDDWCEVLDLRTVVVGQEVQSLITFVKKGRIYSTTGEGVEVKETADDPWRGEAEALVKDFEKAGSRDEERTAAIRLIDHVRSVL